MSEPRPTRLGPYCSTGRVTFAGNGDDFLLWQVQKHEEADLACCLTINQRQLQRLYRLGKDENMP